MSRVMNLGTLSHAADALFVGSEDPYDYGYTGEVGWARSAARGVMADLLERNDSMLSESPEARMEIVDELEVIIWLARAVPNA